MNFYIKKGTTIFQGDLVFVEHPNTNYEGWYMKLRDESTKKEVFRGITTKTPRMYVGQDLTVYERNIKRYGTITKIIHGATNVSRYLRGQKHDVVELVPNKAMLREEVLELQRAIEASTNRLVEIKGILDDAR